MPSHPKHALLGVEQPTRWSSRRAPQIRNLNDLLWPRPRAKGLREYKPNTICGAQVAEAAAAPEDEADDGVSEGDANAWAAAGAANHTARERARTRGARGGV